MKPSYTKNEKTTRKRGVKAVTVEPPALVPATASHAGKFRAAAQAWRRCRADASHWDKVHAATGIEA